MKLSNISGALLVIGLTSPDIPHAPDDIVCSTVVYYMPIRFGHTALHIVFLILRPVALRVV